MINSKPILCGSIAGQVGGLGVAVHNAAYTALGLDYNYVSFSVKSAEKSVSSMRALGIKGLGVSMPFKESVIPYLDDLDAGAKEIGAVNTILNIDNHLCGYNTDYLGIQMALESAVHTEDIKKVIIVGAGGVGKAAIYAVKKYTEHITLYNRNEEKGRKIAELFSVNYGGQPQHMREKDCDLLINATSVGFRSEKSVIEFSQMIENGIVLDLVFDPVETTFLKRAKKNHNEIIPGWQVLLNQGICQFELYTGKKAPVEVMKEVIIETIRNK